MKALAFPAAVAALAISAFAPSAAEAATTAVSVASVSLRAGPSTNYPVVARLPSRAPLTLFGCNAATTWCDVAWDGERGWISATYVSVTYRGSTTVVSPSVAPAVGLAVVGFSYAYWNSHYVGRPSYGHGRRHHHHHGRPHHPDRVKAGGCRNGVCGGVVATPRRVAVGHCGKRHCSGTVIKRPRATYRAGHGVRRPAHGVRMAHGGLRRR